MDRDSANAARLRINRILLSQQLDTQELIPKLIRARIISPEDDVQYIHQGTSKIDRARRLVDCLLSENTEHDDRPANWFLLFRSILLESSPTYAKLVTVLDHTIIRKPDFARHSTEVSVDQSNIGSISEIRGNNPNTNRERVTNIQFDRYAMNKAVIEGSFQKVIGNLTYSSEIPEDLFQQLSRSSHSYDQEQLQNERQAFEQMRRLELMTNLMKTEKSLSNESIFDTQIVDSFLTNTLHQHYFFKYFLSLSSIYGIHYDREFVQAFKNSLAKQNDLLKTIEKGFLLYHFLYNYGRYEYCRDIIECIVQRLTKQMNKQQAVIWIYLFRSCCALVQVHNQSLEIKEAWARIEAANEIAENLKATGIDIANDDYAWLYSVSAQTAYEDANFDACIQYSYRGLKLVNKDNHSLVVDLLCSLTQGLISKWIMNKAQATAVMAVQYAAKYCGRNSPKYISALQQLVQYSNEFIQDPTSVELAQYTIDRARIVYGYESLAVAHCHRGLSKSLITLASVLHSQPNETNNRYPSTPMKESPPSAYLHHANEAYRIAQDWFGVEDRIRLFPFEMTLSHALQARVAANLSEDKNTYFEDAMGYLKDCLSIVQDIFGSMSFKVAQVHRLQSATYLSNKMFNEAEEELNICLQIYKLCLPPNSFHYLVTKASLGLLYKQQGDYRQALSLFRNIADSLDTKTQSFRWINLVMESLIECYSCIEAKENENSPRVKSAAEKIRSELYEWRRTNIKRYNLMNFIHQEPSRSLQQFLHDSTKFQETTDRVHALMHTQQQAKSRILATKTHQET